MNDVYLHLFQEENESISRDKNGGFITLDDIPSMKYTAKVHPYISFRTMQVPLFN